MMSLGMVDVSEETELEGEWECRGERVSISPGCFFEAAVEGLMSWAGSGCLFIDADWIAEASSEATLEAILSRLRSLVDAA